LKLINIDEAALAGLYLISKVADNISSFFRSAKVTSMINTRVSTQQSRRAFLLAK